MNFDDVKSLSVQEINYLFNGVFEQMVVPYAWARKSDHFEVTLQSIGAVRMDAPIAKLYLDGGVEAAYPKREFSPDREVKSKVPKLEMRARLLNLGYIPNS